MQQKRSISITATADRFLQTYERQLYREGYSADLVERLASELYEIIFERLPRGSLKNTPQYIAKDPTLPKYSEYVFSEGCVTGRYSALGDNVILHSLSFNIPPVTEVQRGTAAA